MGSDFSKAWVFSAASCNIPGCGSPLRGEEFYHYHMQDRGSYAQLVEWMKECPEPYKQRIKDLMQRDCDKEYNTDILEEEGFDNTSIWMQNVCTDDYKSHEFKYDLEQILIDVELHWHQIEKEQERKEKAEQEKAQAAAQEAAQSEAQAQAATQAQAQAQTQAQVQSEAERQREKAAQQQELLMATRMSVRRPAGFANVQAQQFNQVQQPAQVIQVKKEPEAPKKFTVELLNKVKENIKVPAGASVEIHYEGKLENGTVFDSSRKRGQTVKFKTNQGQVMRGLDEGVRQLCLGHTARITCPPDYGYGKDGVPGLIPANATLIFEVELINWWI